jgi:hypothetical protein
VTPPGLLRLVKDLLAAGWIPVLTHPERLTWIENGYDLICQIDEAGAAMQITAGSLTGRFGDRPQYWAKLMLEEGRVDILASDSHDPRRRPPKMSDARAVVAEMLGPEAARAMTLDNPMAILKGQPLPGKQRGRQPRTAPGATTVGAAGGAAFGPDVCACAMAGAEAAAEAAGAASTAAASAAASASASLASCCLMRPISVRPNTEPMRVGSTPYSAGRTTVIRSAEAVTAATPVDFNRWPVDGRSALDGRFALYMRVSPVT